MTPGAIAVVCLMLAPPASHAAGASLAAPPSVAPGRAAAAPADRLKAARQRWYQGDATGTAVMLRPWLDSRHGPYGRTRTAGELLLGMAEMRLSNWNLASTYFYRVRKAEDPLAPWGAWYEALVDHKRGRHSVAIRECDAYRDRWPDGLHADDCLVLEGQAWSALGKPYAAIRCFQAWLDHNPDTPRTEEIALAKATAVAHTNPIRGIPMLQELVIRHTFPSTAVGAQQVLAELFEAGEDVTMPSDSRTRMRYATSLRRSGKLVEAWTLFQELQALGDKLDPSGTPLDPELQAWADDNEDLFSWGTRQFDVFVDSALARYQADPSARLGWRIFRAYARGGMYRKAAAWGQRMQQDWGLRSHRNAVAWALLHAGDYEQARARFAELGKSGGRTGRQARFYAAYCALQAGHFDTAIDELGGIADRGRDDAAKAAYWASRALDRKGEPALAEKWAERAIAADDVGWYRMLIEDREWREAGSPDPMPPQTPRSAADNWLLRDGRWHGLGRPATALEPGSVVESSNQGAPASGPITGLMILSKIHAVDATGARAGLSGRTLLTPAPHPGWRSLSWDRLAAGSTRSRPATADPTILGAASQVLPLPVSQEHLPDGYVASAWYDPISAEKTFSRVSQDLADVLPDFPAAYDLARAGLTVDAGRILRDAFDAWDAAGGLTDPVSLRLRTLQVSDWREITIFARQPNLSYRLCIGLARKATNQEDLLAAQRLAYPVVHLPDLWRHGQAYDVDPFLVMAIMRQESRYQVAVLSHSGAIGLLQVMPRTGAKIAALLGDGQYSPADLEVPATNLRYGIYYLSLLLQRFGGSFPLAVASYNGGPHNISRWLRRWLARPEGIGMDALVEQIQYDESRDYVKKVSGNYDAYTRLYGPPWARVSIPPRPTQDDPTIVDF